MEASTTGGSARQPQSRVVVKISSRMLASKCVCVCVCVCVVQLDNLQHVSACKRVDLDPTGMYPPPHMTCMYPPHQMTTFNTSRRASEQTSTSSTATTSAMREHAKIRAISPMKSPRLRRALITPGRVHIYDSVFYFAEKRIFFFMKSLLHRKKENGPLVTAYDAHTHSRTQTHTQVCTRTHTHTVDDDVDTDTHTRIHTYTDTHRRR